MSQQSTRKRRGPVFNVKLQELPSQHPGGNGSSAIPSGRGNSFEGVHDVGGNDGFVVLPPSDLTEVEQVSDDSDKEAIFLLFHHAATDTANRPTKGIQGSPTPFLTI